MPVEEGKSRQLSLPGGKRKKVDSRYIRQERIEMPARVIAIVRTAQGHTTPTQTDAVLALHVSEGHKKPKNALSFYWKLCYAYSTVGDWEENISYENFSDHREECNVFVVQSFLTTMFQPSKQSLNMSVVLALYTQQSLLQDKSIGRN